MKRTFLLALCAVLLLSGSCIRNGSEYEYKELRFPDYKEACVTILNNDILTTNAFDLFLYDTVAVAALARGMDNTSFQILSLDDGHHCGGFGLVGRGADELTNYHLYDIEGDILVAMDTNGKVVEFDLRRAVADDKNCARNHYRLPGLTGQKLDCRDSLYLFMQGVPRFSITDKSAKDTLAKYDDYPYVDERQIDETKFSQRNHFAYNAKYAASPDGSRICSVTEKGMIMEIFRIEDRAIVPERVRRFFRPKMKSITRGADDCIRGAFAVEATDKYIYVLYHDTPCSVEFLDPYLAVFDWNGDEVCRYDFDQRVMRMAVTSDDGRAYCWGYDGDANNYFGYFDMNHASRD